MINMQGIMDTLGDSMRDVRSDYHLTLGAAIDELGKLPTRYVVVFDHSNLCPGVEQSYRGYYSDLAFEPDNGDPKTVDEFLHQLQGALDQEYTGYKGGEFRMGKDTPLWEASYGTSADSHAIIGMHIDLERVILLTKHIE